jgi:alcohol dehydrogenase class IV
VANTEAMGDQFFDAVIGPRYRIPHGTVAGIVLPYVFQFNRLEAGARIALMAPLVSSSPAESEEERIDQVVTRMALLSKDVGLPRLADLGFPASELPTLARQVAEHPGVAMNINPGEITEPVALRILEAAWDESDPLAMEASG